MNSDWPCCFCSYHFSLSFYLVQQSLHRSHLQRQISTMVSTRNAPVSANTRSGRNPYAAVRVKTSIKAKTAKKTKSTNAIGKKAKAYATHPTNKKTTKKTAPTLAIRSNVSIQTNSPITRLQAKKDRRLTRSMGLHHRITTGVCW